MSQQFPGKNPGKVPGDFLRTPSAGCAVDDSHQKHTTAVPKPHQRENGLNVEL